MRRGLRGGGSWACVLALSLCAANSARAASGFGDRELVTAMDALAEGRDSDALNATRSVLSGAMSSELRLDARFLAARAALNLGEATLALEQLTGLERERPEIADFIIGFVARAHRVLGRWELAEEAWQGLLRSHPRSPMAEEARYGLADAAYARGQWSAAATAYETALRTYARSERASAARFTLARLAERMGDYSRAADGYAAFTFGQPTDPFADPARHHLDALIAARRAPAPSFHQHLQRIDKLLSARSLTAAAKALEEVTSLVTRRAYQLAYDERQAKLAFRNQEFPRAVELFARLAQSASGIKQLEYKSWIARCYSAGDRADEAVRAYRELAESYQQHGEAREALYKAAWLAFNGAQYPEAVKLFNEFVQAYPRDRTADEAQWYLAWSTYRMGDLPNALGALAALRQKWPSSSLVQRAWYWEGRIQAQLGEAGAAKSAYEQAVAAAPLDYYGLQAAQRMRELARARAPLALCGEPLVVASAEPMTELINEARTSYEPSADELPEHGFVDMEPAQPLPWGASVFDWQSSAGKRILRLIALDMLRAAADEVSELPVLPGKDKKDVSYARARLLYSLGDFNAAYRIAAIVFRDRLLDKPDPATRPFFRIAYPDAHGTVVEAAAREFDISPWLILSIMRQESAFDDRARSWASAHGLMQLIPATAARIAGILGVHDFNNGVLTDRATNVRFGAWYLAQLLQKFHGNMALAVSSYNAGPLTVAKWVDLRPGLATDEFVEEIPYRETRNYVRRVVGNLAVYSALYRDSAPVLPERIPASYQRNIEF